MATEAPIDELLAGVPAGLLGKKIENDVHLAEIARAITNWQELVPFLGLKAPEQDAIEGNHVGRVQTQKMQLLRTWKGKYGPRATYRNLAIAFFNARKPELIEEICRVLGYPIEISEQDLESTPPPPQQKVPKRSSVTVCKLVKDTHPASNYIFQKYPVPSEGTELSSEHLPVLVKAVSCRLSGRWREVHTCLRITRSHEEINKHFPNDPLRCLILVLDDWLKLMYDQKRDPESPSWRKVVWCVAHMNPAHAEYIAKNYRVLSTFQPGDIAGTADQTPIDISGGDEAFRALVKDTADQLQRVAAKWFEIGVMLGISVDRMEQLRPHSEDINVCLQNIVREWLNSTAATPELRIWPVLVDAVEHSAGGANPALAQTIAAWSREVQGQSQSSRQSPKPTSADNGYSNGISASLDEATASTDTDLTPDDLCDVGEYLVSMKRTQMYQLGLVLGLSYARVKPMTANSDTFVDDVIDAWLNKEDSVEKKGVPSWRTLVRGLRRKRVERDDIADKIVADKGIV